MTMRRLRELALLAILLIGAIALPATTSTAAPDDPPSDQPPAAASRPLTPDVSMYPRGVLLAHQPDATANGAVVASVTTFTDRGGEGAILRSDDEGSSFEQIASIPVSQTNGQDGQCCGTLFELPQQVGALPAGTLLFSASVGQDAGQDRRMDLDIWQSRDAGRTWSYLSACAGAGNEGGLWEPEFSVDARGRLVCHYADETDPVDGTQNLVRVVSEDGVHWGERTVTVRSTPQGTRPGMPVVRTRPDGTYVMVYEICGRPGQYDCVVSTRTSADGWDWGSPDDHGSIVTSVHGRYFSHAPTVAVVDDGTPRGSLLVIGQMLLEADGSVADGNGATVFVGRNGNPTWQEIPAPIAIPDARNHYCPNYSSSLVPLAGGRSFLELASQLGEDDVCRTSFARGGIHA